MGVAIEVVAKIEIEDTVAQEATVHVAGAPQDIPHCVEIIRGPGHVPGLAHMTRVYV
jgi:hypothetical protein